MDIASLIGVLSGFAMVLFGIISSGGVAALGNFIDVPSIIITIGGTMTAMLTSNSMADFISNLKSIGQGFKVSKMDETGTIKKIIELSNVARKEGLLALEEAGGQLEDEFMKKGILLIVDGTEPDLVRGILETELTCIEDRHKSVIGFWENTATMGPAWGMIGTLVGLVNMLKNLEDASTIGPNMAVALLTTLYGSLLANWIATPLATKMKANNASEVMLKEVIIEGLLSIQAGENPRVIEEKLKSFIAPKNRDAISQDGAEGGGE
ncbi:MAG: motility protein A [Lachnospiraceae bacterium]